MAKRILLAALAASAFLGCSNQGNNSSGAGGASSASGGRSETGGSSAKGGSSARTGGSSAAGSSAIGGSSLSLSTATGGTSDGAGASTTSTRSTAGNTGGGTSTTGGRSTTGGTTGAGGVATGGTSQGGTASGGAEGSSSTARTNDDGGPGGKTGNLDAGSVPDANKGDSATGGSAGYQPCPTDGTDCKVLPLGDSITNGVGSSDKGGYRVPLFKLMAAASQKTTFTGSQKSGPNNLQVSGQTFITRHEGHNGWGISQVNPNSGGSKGLTTLIPSPAFDTANGGLPNIILLHIGTNDSGTYSATQMASDLKGLLDQITTAAPNALVVVAQIVPLGYGDNAVIKAYNQAIPGIVDAQVAAKKHVIKIDMFTGFTTSSMIGSDKVHPNDSGYAFKAERWYSIIGSLLPK